MSVAIRSYVFKGKTFQPQEIKWYNLNTGRFISKKPKDVPQDFQMIENPRVAGTVDQLNEFFRINHLPLPQDVKSVVERVVPPPGGMTIESKSPVLSVKPPAYVPPSKVALDIAVITVKAALAAGAPLLVTPKEMQICDRTGGVIITQKETSIRDVPPDQLDALCNFSFNGLMTEAALLNVIDGDTFDLAFFCPLSVFSQRRSERSATGAGAIVVAQDPDTTGLFVKRRCRLYGADAYEVKEERGKVAREYFKGLVKYKGPASTSKKEDVPYLRIQCFTDDRYGRLLVSIFEDKEYKSNLLNKLLEYRHPVYGAVYYTYYGGTKETEMKGTTGTTPVVPALQPLPAPAPSAVYTPLVPSVLVKQEQAVLQMPSQPIVTQPTRVTQVQQSAPTYSYQIPAGPPLQQELQQKPIAQAAPLYSFQQPAAQMFPQVGGSSIASAVPLYSGARTPVPPVYAQPAQRYTYPTGPVV